MSKQPKNGNNERVGRSKEMAAGRNDGDACLQGFHVWIFTEEKETICSKCDTVHDPRIHGVDPFESERWPRS